VYRRKRSIDWRVNIFNCNVEVISTTPVGNRSYKLSFGNLILWHDMEHPWTMKIMVQNPGTKPTKSISCNSIPEMISKSPNGCTIWLIPNPLPERSLGR
jgi:hypothetical protein